MSKPGLDRLETLRAHLGGCGPAPRLQMFLLGDLSVGQITGLWKEGGVSTLRSPFRASFPVVLPRA